ncbi:hypothetical protein [Actibacterium sp. MT2.3-13A]|uniref:hypothetical protein n=1 Tax=Actibacterium sp. MT2.3-13A TaxID=2828332 RepID=UPI001BAA390D|nr:hypothetical protein [Actibacterium sp. MT2.3-13A]
MSTPLKHPPCDVSGAMPIQVWARLFEMQMAMATAWFGAALRLNPFLPAVDTEALSAPHAAPKAAARPGAARAAKPAPRRRRAQARPAQPFRTED